MLLRGNSAVVHIGHLNADEVSRLLCNKVTYPKLSLPMQLSGQLCNVVAVS